MGRMVVAVPLLLLMLLLLLALPRLMPLSAHKGDIYLYVRLLNYLPSLLLFVLYENPFVLVLNALLRLRLP